MSCAVKALAKAVIVLRHGHLLACGAAERIGRDPAALECYLSEIAEL